MNNIPSRRWRATVDLALVVAAAATYFALAVYLELAEQMSRWFSGYEHWQLDELPLTLLLLSVGLSWFGWRRWRELGREMRARQLVEEANVRVLAQNQKLARQLIRLQEQERRYLAQELHDELGQYCVAIKVEAASIARENSDSSPLAQASARAIVDAADHLQSAVRGMLHGLRPNRLEQLGLSTCLQDVIDTWSRRYGIPCALATEGNLDGLDELANVAIYRTVQEGLTNVVGASARHAARSTAVEITLVRRAPRRTAARGSLAVNCQQVVSRGSEQISTAGRADDMRLAHWPTRTCRD